MSDTESKIEKNQLKPQPGLFTPKTAAARWDEQMTAWQECQARTGRRWLSDWESEQAARRYWELVWRYQPERLRLLISKLGPVAGKRILDIGSGPGVLAIPLAEAGAAVTAVEPSAAMLRFLREMASARKSPEIYCHVRRWEDLDPARDLNGNQPFDIVLASLSLLMVGLRECLLKMRQVCSPDGQVFLLWTRGQNQWTDELRWLYPELYGFDYVPKPGADLLLQAVKELRAEVETGEEPDPMPPLSENRPGASSGWHRPPEAGQYFRLPSGCGIKKEPQVAGQVIMESSVSVCKEQILRAKPLPSALPEIKAEEVEFIYREPFNSGAEALAHFQRYFGVAGDDRRRNAVLKKFLERNLTCSNCCLLLEHSFPALLIRW